MLSLKVKHTRRTAIAVLFLLKLDGFVRAGNVNIFAAATSALGEDPVTPT